MTRPLLLMSGRLEARVAAGPLRQWLLEQWDHGHELPSAARAAIVLEELPPTDAAVSPAEPDRAGGGRRVARTEKGSVAWQRLGDGWHAEAHPIRLTLGNAPIRINVAPAAERSEAFWVALQIAMTEAVRAIGLLPLHAAVMARAGQATAVTGASGAGKSTALLQAARAGWTVVAEDLAFLEPASRTVHRWDRGVRLRDDSHALLHDLAGPGAWTRAPDGKLFARYEELRAPCAPTATLARVALLMPAPEPAGPAGPAERTEPLAGADAVRVLWEMTGVPFTDEVRRVVSAHVAALAGRLETVALISRRG